MSRKLRILQVGCGGRAQSHIAAMLASDVVELVALCELDPERLATTGDKFAITTRYTDMATAIAQTKPDLVDIVTPPHIRLGIVQAAINAGAPAILIEKPIALSPSECRALTALGAERLIAVNTQYQWMPHWQQIWEMLRTGALGQVRAIRASTGVNILEQGPHILDLALTAAALSDLPDPQWVMANCDGVEYFATTPVPADTSAVIGMGYARLWFNAGASAPLVPDESVIWYQQQIEIIGARGRIWVSLNQGWTAWIDGVFSQGTTAWPHDDELAQGALFAHLQRVLVGDENWQMFPTRIQVAARNQGVMFACYASAISGKRVEIQSDWDDAIVPGIVRT